MKNLFYLFICGLLLAATPAVRAQSGTTGDLSWSIFGGTLTITGTGAMPDYSYTYISGSWVTTAPWYSSRASITTLSISSGVTSIGDYAFSECSELTSVTIPNSVESIGRHAFSECSRLNTVNFNATDCTTMGDYPVFSGCEALTTLNIGTNVTSIPHYAFAGCSGLTSVTIPESVTSIGWYAFSSCSGLTFVTIPNSVTYIGDYAFFGCTGLTSVTIGSGLASIVFSSAFSSCGNITAFNVSAGNAAYSSDGGVVFNKNKTKLEYCLRRKTGSYTIPSTVTSIGEGAFSGCIGLTSVTIPSSVTYIDDEAFRDCSGLTGTLTIPSLVTYIGYAAFRDCSGLTGTLTIPSSVTSIGSFAFSGCIGLNTVNFNATDCAIMGFAVGKRKVGPQPIFSDCSGLTTVNIGTSVTRIPDKVFDNCTSLATVNFNATACTEISYSFSSCTALTTLNIGSNVTLIPDHAFSGCSGLTGTLTIPNSVTSIGSSAFSNCYGLTSVTIPNSVTTIGSYVFYYCSGLTSVTIPDKVTSIGEGAFYYCSGLTTLTLGSGVTSIGDGAFRDCSGLTSVTIPNSVISIGDVAFSECSELTSVTIPNSVESIGSYAFRGCSGLTSVIIPNSVTSIGYGAFYDCSGLTEIINLATTPQPITSDVFGGVSKTTCVLRVPAASVAAYRAAVEWKDFMIIMATVPPTGVTLNKTRLSLVAGGSEMLTATVAPANATVKTVVWSSSNEAAATVNSNGTVAAVAAGTATITATTQDGGKIANCEVTVPAVISVTVSPPTASVQKGATQQFTATVTVTNAPQDVTWSIDGNALTATNISASGLLTVAAGEMATTLTVTVKSVFDGTKTGTATVTVVTPPAVTSVTVSPATATVQKGATHQFTASVTVQGDASQTVTWSVAGHALTATTISENGLLTVAANETATTLTITATSVFDGTKKGTATVTIPQVTSVTITSYSYIAGQQNTTCQFTATVATTGDASQEVRWSVTGNTSSGTTIDTNGLLMVAANEMAASLTVTATSDFDNTKKDAATIPVFGTTGVGELDIPNLKAYPNPFTDALHIAGAEGCTLRVFTENGTVVHVQKITGANETVHLKGLPAGVYFFRLEKDGKAKTIKIVRE